LQIIQHQNILAQNLISYKTNVKKDNILQLINYIINNLNAINTEIKNKVIYTIKSEKNEYQDVEILIPVKDKISISSGWQYKSIFKMYNAVRIRHEGNFNDIEKTKQYILKYIDENDLTPVTSPYYVVIRNENNFTTECIIDIYIGINCNSL